MGYATEPLIFVTGASRSGTTMVTTILGSHSRVAGLREMQYFGEFCDPRRDPPQRRIDTRDAIAALFARQERGIVAGEGQRSSDPGVDRLVRELPPDAGAAEIFAAATAEFAARAGKVVPCEQTPRNIYYARALLEWYPQARFVHLLRDPRGVMASQKFRWQRRSLLRDPSVMSRRQQIRTWVNYHPYTVTQLWNRATTLALELENHPRVHLLRLEDLLREPEARVRALCDFLGLEFEPAMLDIEQVNSSYVSSREAARGFSLAPIDAWRGKLSGDECAVINRRCGALMQRLGYEPEPAARSLLGPVRSGAHYVLHLAGAALVNPQRLRIQARGLLGGSSSREASRTSGTADATSPDGDTEEQNDRRRVPVFGLRCSDMPLPAAARQLVGWAAAGETRRVVFVNAHSMNVAARDARFRDALHDADVVYADGVGMAMAARLQGERLLHNVNGTDLFPYLCREAAAAGVPLALLGAAPGVADECVRVLAERHPSLEVAFARDGYFDERDTNAIIDAINESGAGILLVAMGVPRQELWLREHAARLRVPVTMGVGGLFDFVSGRVPRAPVALRRLRLEWLFRLTVEPRRLFGRYVIGNPAFLGRAFRYAATGRLASPASRETVSR